MEKGQKVVVKCSKKIGNELYPYKTVKGTIVQTCTEFITIDNGLYRESFPTSDITKGLVVITAAVQ